MTKIYKRYEVVFDILLIVLVGVISYLILAPGLGYYRDDWHIVYGGRVFGPEIFPVMFSIDRPFVGIIYEFLYHILGDRILNWQIAALSIRLVGVLGMFWIVLMLWPKQRMAATFMAILIVVYPGFLQQSNAMTYINQEITLTMAIFSIALTVAAYQTSGIRRLILIILSMLGQGLYLISYEYMIGLEGMRLALVFYLSVRQGGGRLKNLASTLKKYAPYALVLCLYLVWRVGFFQSSRPAVSLPTLFQLYLDAPLLQMVRIFVRLLQDFIEVLLGAWFINPYLVYNQIRLREFLAALALGVSVLVLIYIFMQLDERATQESKQKADFGWTKAAMLIGSFSLLATILPVVAANRAVTFGSILASAFDRYTLQSSLGAIMLLTGALFHPSVGRAMRVGLLGMFVIVGIVSQHSATIVFRNSWSHTRQFWWEMTWRVPQLEPDTNLIVFFPAKVNAAVEGYHVAYPANLIYYPDSQEQILSSEIPNVTIIEKLLMGVSEAGKKRTIPFTRDFRNTLLAYYPSAISCLHVVNGDSELIPARMDQDSAVRMIIPYSDVGRIMTDQPFHLPPIDIFGEEPAHTWCFYYQRASLAVQKRDWEEVVHLGDEAQSLGFKPYELSEWWPFILGYAHHGNYDTAGELTARIKGIPYIRHQICDQSYDFPAGLSLEGRQFVADRMCNQ